MSSLSLALLVANLIAAATILWFGRREERVIILVAIAYVCLPPLVYDYQFNTFRYGVFLLEVVWMCVLLWGSLRLDRWWPLVAASAQLLALLSHILPFLFFKVYLWSAVTVRLGLWAVVSFVLLLGAWEAWAHWAVTFKGVTRGNRMEVRNRNTVSATLVRKRY